MARPTQAALYLLLLSTMRKRISRPRRTDTTVCSVSARRSRYRLTYSWHVHACLHPGFTLEVGEWAGCGEEYIGGIVITGDTNNGFDYLTRLLEAAMASVPDVEREFRKALAAGTGG